MDVVAAIEGMGGKASRASLILATSRAQVDHALQHGHVVRVGQGRILLWTTVLRRLASPSSSYAVFYHRCSTVSR